MNQMVIHLISTPRTISTTMMYSFNQRPCTIGLDEPYYAYWLKKTGIDHPGADETLKRYSTDPNKILHQIRTLASPIVFVKNMSKHLTGVDLSPMQSWSHLFLIRHPAHIIYSMEKVLDQIDPTDVGHDEQYRYYQELTKQGSKCIVVKSEDILINPEHKLQHLCKELGILYKPEMLTWSAGPKDIDGSWAKYWYSNVHKSEGWIKRTARPLPEVKNQLLLDKNLPYFKELEKHAI